MSGSDVTGDRTPISRLLWGAVAIVMALGVGGLGIHGLYGIGWMTSFYEALAVITTAGDRRINPVTPAETAFTFALLAVGTALWIYWLSVVVTALVAVDRSRRERRVELRLQHMTNHYVVVGAGRVGAAVAHELLQADASVVMVDTDRDRVAAVAPSRRLLASTVAGYDAEQFRRLRLDHARGLALVLPDDAHNLFALLAAQDVSPRIPVVARAQTQESAHHFQRLGVQDVVLPDAVGGLRLARMLLKPRAHELIMAMLDETAVDVHEVEIHPGHRMEGQPVSGVREAFGSRHTLLGYWRGGTSHVAPPADARIQAGDVLILLEPPGGAGV
jgi:voltage-gated potassium channel